MRIAIAALSAVTMLAVAGPAASQQKETKREQPVSKAETLLFMDSHLEPIKKDGALRYRVSKTGSLEEPFEDDVNLAVTFDKDGARVVTPQFASGKQRDGYGPVPGALSNPVVLYFLESDLNEMKRLTGGGTLFFRNRIRMALAEKAQVRPVEFRLGDRTVKGTEIRIQPYVDHPVAQEKSKDRFPWLLGKYYVFTLSEQVPGGVYQMRAVIPDAPGGGKTPDKTLLEDTLTFTGFDTKG